MTVQQFAYLGCPNKIRTALINSGGPALSEEVIRKKLRMRPQPLEFRVDEPIDSDAVIYSPRRIPHHTATMAASHGATSLVEARKPKIRLSEEERRRMERIAKRIPDRDPLVPVAFPNHNQPPERRAPDYGKRLINYVMRAANVKEEQFFAKVRFGRATAAASLVVVVLRELDAKRYSFPIIARLLGKNDHSTMIYAAEQWPTYAIKYPDIAALHSKVLAHLQSEGEGE